MPDNWVYIGRFQPFHKGHHNRLLEMLATGKRVYLVVGSSFQAPTLRNPWTCHDRETMIRACLCDEDNKKLTVIGQEDVPDDREWARLILARVNHWHSGGSIGTVCSNEKTAASYKEFFPDWEIRMDSRTSLSATDVRKQFFDFDHLPGNEEDSWAGMVPPEVVGYLSAWRQYKTMLYFEMFKQQRAMNLKPVVNIPD